MRQEFARQLYKEMALNDNIWLITGDLGFGLFDNIRDDFPDRFLNTGAAEQAMMDIAVGLALEGKLPFVYSITPFLLYRAFETIRTYINHEKIPVILVGSGRDQDYEHDGFSHYAGDDKMLFDQWVGKLYFSGILSNIEPIWPKDKKDMLNDIDFILHNRQPFYINLKR